MANAVADARGAPWPTTSAAPRGILRWICTSNPFYVLSAVLFLGGLRLSVEAQPEGVQAVALMAGLAGYTLLLAATAWLLVRFCKVWDDVRTLLLLVVLLFLATSVTFDEVLVFNPERGLVCFGAGLLFAVVVSEALLRGLGLRLPSWFRVPYYLLLGLFFLYPLFLQPLLADPRGEALQWGLFGFSTVAGLIFLMLLPAIRAGDAGLRDSAAPWSWPAYPWALFVILAIAVPGRALLLCWSMQLLGAARPDLLIFGPYFLVPFGFALAVLVLEAGLVTRRASLLAVALLLPVGLIVLAGVGHRGDLIYQEFLTLFRFRLGGDPLFVALILGTAYYGYAVLRRVPLAVDALTAALVVLALTPTNVLARGWPRLSALEPLLAAGVLQITVGLWRRSSVRGLAGLGALLAGVVLALPVVAPGEPAGVLLVGHIGVLGLLLLGGLFRDRLGNLLQVVGVALMLIAGLSAVYLWLRPQPPAPRWLLGLYPLALAAMLLVYGWWVRRAWIPRLAGLVVACWLGAVSWEGYWTLRQIVQGLDYLALSLALFAVAVLVSLGKAGLLSRPRSGQLGRVETDPTG
jgi:hypothetical protein